MLSLRVARTVHAPLVLSLCLATSSACVAAGDLQASPADQALTVQIAALGDAPQIRFATADGRVLATATTPEGTKQTAAYLHDEGYRFASAEVQDEQGRWHPLPRIPRSTATAAEAASAQESVDCAQVSLAEDLDRGFACHPAVRVAAGLVVIAAVVLLALPNASTLSWRAPAAPPLDLLAGVDLTSKTLEEKMAAIVGTAHSSVPRDVADQLASQWRTFSLAVSNGNPRYVELNRLVDSKLREYADARHDQSARMVIIYELLNVLDPNKSS